MGKQAIFTVFPLFMERLILGSAVYNYANLLVHSVLHGLH